jgi:hypothetical protein
MFNKEIRDFTFHMNIVSRLSPSTRGATNADSICRFLDICHKFATSLEESFALLELV